MDNRPFTPEIVTYEKDIVDAFDLMSTSMAQSGCIEFDDDLHRVAETVKKFAEQTEERQGRLEQENILLRGEIEAYHKRQEMIEDKLAAYAKLYHI